MRDRETVAEIACLIGLLGYLVWVPLPFGSASDSALTAFVVPPLLLKDQRTLVRRECTHGV